MWSCSNKCTVPGASSIHSDVNIHLYVVWFSAHIAPFVAHIEFLRAGRCSNFTARARLFVHVEYWLLMFNEIVFFLFAAAATLLCKHANRRTNTKCGHDIVLALHIRFYIYMWWRDVLERSLFLTFRCLIPFHRLFTIFFRGKIEISNFLRRELSVLVQVEHTCAMFFFSFIFLLPCWSFACFACFVVKKKLLALWRISDFASEKLNFSLFPLS